MNWPAPSTLPPPASEPTETDAERRGLSAVPVAAWLSLLGSVLLLLAAIAVVAGNWDAIGRGLRVAGLVAGTAALLVGSERLRRLVPTTAGVIAHVGTYLTAFVGIATVSLLGAAWPTCIVVGGAALVAATAVQAGRWRRITMHLAQVVGFGLIATGAAALLDTTTGLVAVLLSVCLLVARARRRSVVLAVAAVLSPALAALAEAGIGAGTLARAGLVGEPLGWSGPLVGLVAATVIGAIGMNRRNDSLVLFAAASPVLGIVTGLAAADASATSWWCVPALGLIAAELGARILPAPRRSPTVDELLDLAAGATTVGLWLSPALVGIAQWDGSTDGRWAVPVALTGIAVALSTLRWHERDSRLVDVGLAGLAASLVASVVAFDVLTSVVAGVAVAAVGAAAVLSRRLSPTALYGSAVWAGPAIAAAAEPGSWVPTAVSVVLLALLAAIVLAARARLAAASRLFGWIEMTIVAGATALLATTLWDGYAPTIALGVGSLAALAAVLVDRRHSVWSVVFVAVTGLIGFDAATSGGALAPSYVIGWVVVTATFAVLRLVDRNPLWSHAAAGAAVLAAATSAAWFGIGAVDVTVMTMLATVALTGVAWTIGRSPLDAAAVTAGVVLVATTTFPIDPAWASITWVLVGLQVAVIGLALDLRIVSWAGLAVSAGGLVDWWETSGLHAWFVEAVEPLDVVAGDVWAASLSLAALVAGIVLRRTLTTSSWIAYTAALVIPGLWLTAAQLDRDPVWAVPLLLTIGVGATVTGGWRRLAAPLVGGTVLTAVGVLLAIDSDLTSVPTWVWLTFGGGLLIGAAVLIERTGRPGSPDLRELIARWS